MVLPMKEVIIMTGREIIKAIMNEQGVSNAEMAGRLNITQATLWDRLNNKKVKDIPLSLMSEMLRVLDYSIQIVPRATRIPDKSFKVE
jgi:transcriptional regulator with XRE-family HTH domain